jgi:hypothetical protein
VMLLLDLVHGSQVASIKDVLGLVLLLTFLFLVNRWDISINTLKSQGIRLLFLNGEDLFEGLGVIGNDAVYPAAGHFLHVFGVVNRPN